MYNWIWAIRNFPAVHVHYLFVSQNDISLPSTGPTHGGSKIQGMNLKLDKEKMKLGHRRVDEAGQVTYKKVCWFSPEQLVLLQFKMIKLRFKFGSSFSIVHSIVWC